MNIQKWSGLVSAASPYAVPAGATTDQHNLQIHKPGQLIPRPGMSFVFEASTGAVVGLHRISPGSTLPDRLLNFYISDEPSTGTYQHSLASITTVNNALVADAIYSVTANVIVRPSFAEDRHGSVYAFFGHGIMPQTYRYGVDATDTVDFGMPAPTVAPAVAASGDGWFIERVDVLSSGTSYYTAPTLTVVPATGDTPSRAATVRAVVQAGQIVAVDVVDGGSDYKGVPTIAVSNEQVGTGFSARGIRSVASAVFGFLDSTAQASGYPTTGNYDTAKTHSFDLSTTSPTIAYKDGSTTKSVPAVFDAIAGTYTAIIPLKAVSPATGTEAYAEFTFNALSSAAKLGNTTVNYQTGATQETTSAGTTIKFRHAQTNWYTTTDYYENTVTPADQGIDNKYTYNANANRDAFWAFMPNPSQMKFAKRQVRSRFWKSGDFFSSGNHVVDYANFYFPDYDYIGYRLLIGPETGLTSESNWEVGRALVQRDGNGRPYIDITLKPAKQADGTPYFAEPGTVYPKARFFLKDCPDGWVVNNTQPLSAGDKWKRRYIPLNGQDRRVLATDTDSPTSGSPSGTLPSYDLKNASNAELTAIDTAQFWWNTGHVAGGAHPQARPIVDFRTTSAGNTTGIGAGTVEIVNAADAGGKMQRGTKFVVRFEQYNSSRYVRSQDKDDDFSWVTAPLNQSKFPLYQNITQADLERNGAFGAVYADFYFEANVLDTTLSDPSLLLPGAVTSAKVTVTGTGWGSAGEAAEVTLRQTATTSVSFTDSETYRWEAVQLIASSTAQRIGSVTILSGGQNYYREPTILFRGGGGYGLRVQSAVSGGRVTSVVVVDGGDGFTSDTILYTDVQPAKLLPVLRGTMRGIYRCAYRYADYSQTKILATTITTTSGSRTATLASTTGVKPDMQITDAAAVPHLVKIASISGNTITLATPATATAVAQACVIRDMSLPVTYSDFSPITEVDASANGSGRASTMTWVLPGVTPPPRAQYVEFFRTSSDQSLVFYRLEQYGVVANGIVNIQGTDTLSDEDLFDLDRPGYAALPVVLPNGGLNAFRFGTPRTDMSVAVSWQDRLWYGVSTSGLDANTVFFSEYDEYESCPDINEIPIQNNLRSTDYLTALVPFGSTLMAMQSAHCYTIAFNTDPAVDAVVTLSAHRGCLSQRCWDIFDEYLYAMDERGVYRMSKNGETETLSTNIRDFFTEPRIDFAKRATFHLKVDQTRGVLRAFVSLAGQSAPYPTLALCYHIANETWWTEGWPNSITAATDYRSPSQPDAPVYGGVDGCLYAMSGLSDVTFRDLISVAVTNGGSGYTSAPTVTAAGGYGAVLQAIIRDGQVVEVLVVRGGYGYGDAPEDLPYDPDVAITFSGGGGSGAAATGTARAPNSAVVDDVPTRIRASIPWTMRTGPMELEYEGNARGGDALMDRSITVTYRPCATSTTLILREYYNNSPTPRSNVMRRDRGTGFVHDTTGAKTTLDMIATRSSLGLSTGLAKARFAGRSLDDITSADRHLAVELSCDSALSTNDATLSQPLIYALEVRGVVDGD